MLILLLGSLGEIGRRCGAIFKEESFLPVAKKYFRTEACNLHHHNDTRTYYSEEEVRSCDFSYTCNGMLIGFDQSEILKAAHGGEDRYLSISPDNFDFVQELKTAFGGYVRVIALYIDNSTLSAIAASYPDTTEEERSIRINTGASLHQKIISERAYIDDIVIYSGEQSVFNTESLVRQFRMVIANGRKIEMQLNDINRVALPYEGARDFIFFSYSHADARTAQSVLILLQRNGYRVWYDQGLRGGDNWRRILASKINECRNFIVLVSPDSVDSSEVESELDAVFERGNAIRVIPIQLTTEREGTRLNMHPRLRTCNRIFFENNPHFEEDLLRALDGETRENKG